jgi:hypothetical protein
LVVPVAGDNRGNACQSRNRIRAVADNNCVKPTNEVQVRMRTAVQRNRWDAVAVQVAVVHSDIAIA